MVLTTYLVMLLAAAVQFSRTALKTVSQTDELTRLPNRRALRSTQKREYERAQRRPRGQVMVVCALPAERGHGRSKSRERHRKACHLLRLRPAMWLAPDPARRSCHRCARRRRPSRQPGLCMPQGHRRARDRLSPTARAWSVEICGARGAGAWQEISWQQAVREIALRIEAITTAHGAESLAYSNGTFRGGDWGIGERFLNRFGSPNSFCRHSPSAAAWRSMTS